ncbi:MAG: D-TA family PLP-dependent enzyme [Tissierellia bacterium]|nr:D-TA family PLP-dependent enzyme [Tissierellia bacterium]
MDYKNLDTPALIIDYDIMIDNLKKMQKYADKENVKLRPHTKTHKMPRVAKMQEEYGAKGIAVAKVEEAEVMAKFGLKDIFIANEIVGSKKLHRIRKLAENIDITFGIDSVEQCKMIEEVFEGAKKRAQVLVEIEVGENRSGIIEMDDFLDLLEYIGSSNNIYLNGIFSHDGHSYKAKSMSEVKKIHLESQKQTLEFANCAQREGLYLETVSIGSTPSLINDLPILEGVTEIRPGTYVFMDAAQGLGYGSLAMNAASILTTVISKPTIMRVITDVGAKGLTMQRRDVGITKTKGLGLIKGFPNSQIDSVFDEHAIIYDEEISEKVKIGDTLEIIPNHICPVVNLYDEAYFVQNGKVIEVVKIECRGKMK